MSHTKKPWAICPSGVRGSTIVDANGFSIAKAVDHALTVNDEKWFLRKSDDVLGNARRIVACVNACAGIPTEDLERHKDDTAPVFELLMRASKQRDELLAALEAFVNYDIASNGDVSLFDCEHIWSNAEAAIANVRKAAGKCYYTPDGTLMNADGTRSIFDDVDQ